MRIRKIETDEQVGVEVITNQSLDIYTACDYAGIDVDDYDDLEAELYMDCNE